MKVYELMNMLSKLPLDTDIYFSLTITPDTLKHMQLVDGGIEEIISDIDNIRAGVREMYLTGVHLEMLGKTQCRE